MDYGLHSLRIAVWIASGLLWIAACSQSEAHAEWYTVSGEDVIVQDMMEFCGLGHLLHFQCASSEFGSWPLEASVLSIFRIR